MYTQLQTGEIDSIEDQYFVSEQTFEHNLDRPLIVTSASNDVGISVFVEQKLENDGKIEAFVVRSAFTFNQMNFSDVLENMKLEKQEDTIEIHVPIMIFMSPF